jgi:hypothetical protein
MIKWFAEFKYDNSSALMMIEDLRKEADRINGEGFD